MAVNKLLSFLLIIFAIALTWTVANEDNNDLKSDIEKAELDTPVISRHKRFIVFPDGSSFQLVFCTQTHGYLQVGDIVWFGTTAALAWELPSDPTFFHKLKKYEKGFAQKRKDTVVLIDEDGKVITTVPYKRKKPIINPAFAKRSINDQENKKVVYKKMHEMHKNKSFFKGLDEKSIEFHRNGRKSLYLKLDSFFETQGYPGKPCVQRMVCENSKLKNHQGLFLEEIIKITFTLPQSSNYSFTDDYDKAIEKTDCAKTYSQCEITNE